MANIGKTEIKTRLLEKFPERVRFVGEPHGLLTMATDAETILDVLEFLKTDPQIAFAYLTDITAVHYPESALPFTVVYHLHSWVNRVRLRIHVPVGGEPPLVPSATGLWQGANWMERETYDFFGIRFTGHPDLRRILNVDDMEAFPMRKEFPLEDPNRVDKKDYFFGR